MQPTFRDLSMNITGSLAKQQQKLVALATDSDKELFGLVPQRWMEFTAYVRKMIVDHSLGASENRLRLISFGVFNCADSVAKFWRARALYFREAVACLVGGPERMTSTDYSHVTLWLYSAQAEVAEVLECGGPAAAVYAKRMSQIILAGVVDGLSLDAPAMSSKLKSAMQALEQQRADAAEMLQLMAAHCPREDSFLKPLPEIRAMWNAMAAEPGDEATGGAAVGVASTSEEETVPAMAMHSLALHLEQKLYDWAFQGEHASTLAPDAHADTLMGDAFDPAAAIYWTKTELCVAPEKDLVFNMIGEVSRVPAVGGYKMCTVSNVDLFVNPSGKDFTVPEFVPAWLLPLDTDDLRKAETGDDGNVARIITLEAVQKDIPFSYSYTYFAARKTIKTTLTVWQLKMPESDAFTKEIAAAPTNTRFRVARGEIKNAVKTAPKLKKAARGKGRGKGAADSEHQPQQNVPAEQRHLLR
ncbi:unnamed protein product [Prorocentrum cordatum]|uniref:Uncharacterized protein n=1 Tax=Prorocentrum cordatum TaxID=2364126 RepID=A0ABN9XHA2_9DINO|nr:unnamed protein product [Polarella glacialis]